MTFEIKRYTPKNRGEWDAFVNNSRNATFLHFRNYMEYHSDRFRDASCMAYKNGRLIALLPANITSDGVIHSHQGLTYGGWLLPPAHLDGSDLSEIFGAALDCWRKEGFTALDYKAIPTIYHRQPSQEDIYILSRLGATLYDAKLSMSIPLDQPVRYNQLRRRSLTKTASLPFTIEELGSITPFMNLLCDCLHERYGTQPVHSEEELTLLRDRFPENIRIFILSLDGHVEAGVCIYDTGIVAHAQYIASTPRGRELNLLTPLFHKLITDTFSSRRYFDFGTSNQQEGPHLNAGLLRQKASFGATGVVHLTYHLKI